MLNYVSKISKSDIKHDSVIMNMNSVTTAEENGGKKRFEKLIELDINGAMHISVHIWSKSAPSVSSHHWSNVSFL